MTISSKLYAGAKVTQMITPVVLNATTLSSKFDMQDYSDLMIVANIGASGDTWSGSNHMEFEVQDSPDDVTYTAVVDANISNPVTGKTATGTFLSLTANAQGSTSYAVAYRGNNRYVKVNVRCTGTLSTGTPMDVIGLGWVSRAQPVNAG